MLTPYTVNIMTIIQFPHLHISKNNDNHNYCVVQCDGSIPKLRAEISFTRSEESALVVVCQRS